jgi:hypothetical protein
LVSIRPGLNRLGREGQQQGLCIDIFCQKEKQMKRNTFLGFLFGFLYFIQIHAPTAAAAVTPTAKTRDFCIFSEI